MRLELIELKDADKQTLGMSTDCFLLSAWITKWVVGSRAAECLSSLQGCLDQVWNWPKGQMTPNCSWCNGLSLSCDTFQVRSAASVAAGWEYFPNWLSTKNINMKQVKVEKKYVVATKDSSEVKQATKEKAFIWNLHLKVCSSRSQSFKGVKVKTKVWREMKAEGARRRTFWCSPQIPQINNGLNCLNVARSAWTPEKTKTAFTGVGKVLRSWPSRLKVLEAPSPPPTSSKHQIPDPDRGTNCGQISLIKDRLTRPYTHTSIVPWIYWDSTKKAYCYIFRV